MKYQLSFKAMILTMLMIPAIASSVCASDLVGVFFDEIYQNNSLEVGQTPTLVDAYLVLLDPSAPGGVAGWELCVDIDGPGTLLNWELAGQALNVMTPPCFTVGLGDPPLPGGDQVLLASFQVFVQEMAPIALTLEPVWNSSIPGEMAYLSHSDPGELVAMLPVTGMPEVAWINQGVPVANVSPTHLAFAGILVGTSHVRTIDVSNSGGGPLLLDISLDEGCEGFEILIPAGPYSVLPNQTLEIPVRFSPTELQTYNCLLDLGTTFANPVPLSGFGREPIMDWAINGDSDFGEVLIGQSLVRGFTVANTGEAPFVLDPVFVDDCPGFSVLDPGPYTLAVGEVRVFQVSFIPTEPGAVSCILNLGKYWVASPSRPKPDSPSRISRWNPGHWTLVRWYSPAVIICPCV